MAQIALTMVLARPLSQLINAYPQRPIGQVTPSVRAAAYGITREMLVSVRTSVYVDDIVVHVYGERAAVATTL